MSLLRPLLLDAVPTIQQTAALALGRLANYNDDLAEAIVKGDILPQLVYSLAEQNVRLFLSQNLPRPVFSFSTLRCFCTVQCQIFSTELDFLQYVAESGL